MSKEDCTRPDLELLLPDYYTGHLAPEHEEEIRNHLEECRSCRNSLRVMATISGKNRPSRTDDETGHFSPQLLSRYYSAPGSLDSALITKIRSHVESCPRCRADLKFLQDSDQDLRLYAASRNKSGGWWKKLLRRFIRH